MCCISFLFTFLWICEAVETRPAKIVRSEESIDFSKCVICQRNSADDLLITKSLTWILTLFSLRVCRVNTFGTFENVHAVNIKVTGPTRQANPKSTQVNIVTQNKNFSFLNVHNGNSQQKLRKNRRPTVDPPISKMTYTSYNSTDCHSLL